MVWRSIALAGAALFSVVGCDPGGSSGKDTGAKPKIGFVQVQSTLSLDELREGFIEGLAEAGFREGVDVVIERQNAQGDQTALPLMIDRFRQDGVTLIGTASTQALSQAIQRGADTPIVFCGVIDPVAAGVGPSLEQKKANVTGVYNPFPIEEGVRLVRDFMPEVRRIGTLYDPAEPFSETQLRQFRAACADMGIEAIAVSVTATGEVVTGMQALQARGAQAVMQLPGNTVNAGLDGQIKQAETMKLPIFSVQTDQVPRGVVAAVGLDLRQAGRDAGKLAAEVLRGKKPADIPIQATQSRTFAFNEEAAGKFGLQIPASVREQATKP